MVSSGTVTLDRIENVLRVQQVPAGLLDRLKCVEHTLAKDKQRGDHLQASGKLIHRVEPLGDESCSDREAQHVGTTFSGLKPVVR